MHCIYRIYKPNTIVRDYLISVLQESTSGIPTIISKYLFYIYFFNTKHKTDLQKIKKIQIFPKIEPSTKLRTTIDKNRPPARNGENALRNSIAPSSHGFSKIKSNRKK